jgi:ribosomal protein S18 acetylase RimI-like enzyme
VSSPAGSEPALLRAIDAYLDAVPRSAARTESIGPLTLFVREEPGWPYYARPTPGAAAVRPADVRAVRSRQRGLGIPETFEWIAELTPEMGPAAASTRLEVRSHPLMRLRRFRPVEPWPGYSVRLIEPGEDLRLVQSVPAVAFSNPGVDAGNVGAEALAEAAARQEDVQLAFAEDRLARGLTVTAAVFAAAMPVAVGSHQPLGDATEIVGVGVLPAFRRRGLGAAVTSALVADAMGRGARLVFLSAGDPEIARIYQRLGFEVVGTAGAAEPPEVTPA